MEEEINGLNFEFMAGLQTDKEKAEYIFNMAKLQFDLPDDAEMVDFDVRFNDVKGCRWVCGIDKYGNRYCGCA